MAHGEIYLQLSVRFPDDAKVRALARYGRNARPARDLYVQMCLYCKDNLSDGFVPVEQIGIMAYPDSPAMGKKDAAFLVEVGLIIPTDGGWLVPGFLKRNRSRDSVKKRSEEKKRAAAKANHVRWHVERGEVKPECEWCQLGSDDDANSDAKPDAMSDRSTDPGTDPKPDPNSDPPCTPTGIHRDRVIGHRTETESESSPTDPDPDPSPPESAPPEPDAPPRAEPQPDDEDQDLDKLNERIEGRIIELLVEYAGRTVDRAWASRVRKQLLDDREVTNPLAYVAAAIRGEPHRYVPSSTPVEAGNAVIAQINAVDRDETAAATERGAPEVRAAIAAARARRAAST